MCSAQLASQTPLDYEACDRYEVVLLAVGDGARSGDGIERRSRGSVCISNYRPFYDPTCTKEASYALAPSQTLGSATQLVPAGGGGSGGDNRSGGSSSGSSSIGANRSWEPEQA